MSANSVDFVLERRCRRFLPDSRVFACGDGIRLSNVGLRVVAVRLAGIGRLRFRPLAQCLSRPYHPALLRRRRRSSVLLETVPRFVLPIRFAFASSWRRAFRSAALESATRAGVSGLEGRVVKRLLPGLFPGEGRRREARAQEKSNEGVLSASGFSGVASKITLAARLPSRTRLGRPPRTVGGIRTIQREPSSSVWTLPRSPVLSVSLTYARPAGAGSLPALRFEQRRRAIGAPLPLLAAWRSILAPAPSAFAFRPADGRCVAHAALFTHTNSAYRFTPTKTATASSDHQPTLSARSAVETSWSPCPILICQFTRPPSPARRTTSSAIETFAAPDRDTAPQAPTRCNAAPSHRRSSPRAASLAP
jgi:hypothetical protein